MSRSRALLGAFTNQRRAVILAAVLVLAGVWIMTSLGEWPIGIFVGAGIVLGLVNHVLTELTLLQAVDSGDLPTRKQFALSSLVRLMAISLVAVALAAVFWPDGATVLIGLALFHLIALVLTGIPLLKEIRET